MMGRRGRLFPLGRSQPRPGQERSVPMHVLETERLLFRNHEDADMEPYCEMESGPEYRAPSGTC